MRHELRAALYELFWWLRTLDWKEVASVAGIAALAYVLVFLIALL